MTTYDRIAIGRSVNYQEHLRLEETKRYTGENGKATTSAFLSMLGYLL